MLAMTGSIPGRKHGGRVLARWVYGTRSRFTTAAWLLRPDHASRVMLRHTREI
jgi:hypothetical protein